MYCFFVSFFFHYKVSKSGHTWFWQVRSLLEICEFIFWTWECGCWLRMMGEYWPWSRHRASRRPCSMDRGRGLRLRGHWWGPLWCSIGWRLWWDGFIEGYGSGLVLPQVGYGSLRAASQDLQVTDVQIVLKITWFSGKNKEPQRISNGVIFIVMTS